MLLAEKKKMVRTPLQLEYASIRSVNVHNSKLHPEKHMKFQQKKEKLTMDHQHFFNKFITMLKSN